MSRHTNGMGRLVAGMAMVALASCGGTQSGVTDGTDNGATGAGAGNPCAPADVADNPCVGEPVLKSMGPAFDATVLAADGSHVQLSAAWAHTTAVIVFYRGHW